MDGWMDGARGGGAGRRVEVFLFVGCVSEGMAWVAGWLGGWAVGFCIDWVNGFGGGDWGSGWMGIWFLG